MVHSKKSFGPLLCLLGLLLALTASAKPPPSKGAWPDSLPYATGGFVLALAGVFLWRQKTPGKMPLFAGAGMGQNRQNYKELWLAFLEDLQALHGRSATLSLAEISQQLEYLQDRFILPLAQARMTFLVGSKQEQGLERLAVFSRGELWINRAQSAAGDQHKEETLVSLNWALESFLAVQNSFSKV